MRRTSRTSLRQLIDANKQELEKDQAFLEKVDKKIENRHLNEIAKLK
ncbi:FbpB family small basic protein [Metabacillus fastidiosus]